MAINYKKKNVLKNNLAKKWAEKQKTYYYNTYRAGVKRNNWNYCLGLRSPLFYHALFYAFHLQ